MARGELLSPSEGHHSQAWNLERQGIKQFTKLLFPAGGVCCQRLLAGIRVRLFISLGCSRSEARFVNGSSGHLERSQISTFQQTSGLHKHAPTGLAFCDNRAGMSPDCDGYTE